MSTKKQSYEFATAWQTSLNASTLWMANTFTTDTAYNATSIKLWMYNTGDCTGQTITASLRATSGAIPTGADLGGIMGTMDAGTITTDKGGALYEITFSSGIALSTSTTYAIIFRNNTSGTYYPRLFGDTPGLGYGYCRSTNSGSTWGDYPFTLYYEVWGEDLPTTSIKSVDGLAIASVKSVNGLAKASIKNINGLA